MVLRDAVFWLTAADWQAPTADRLGDAVALPARDSEQARQTAPPRRPVALLAADDVKTRRNLKPHELLMPDFLGFSVPIVGMVSAAGILLMPIKSLAHQSTRKSRSARFSS